MSEKISSSSIYLFLAKQDDWKEKADINNNNEITKGEMREYLSSSDFENWCGVSIKDVSADVFNKFWASIDANVANNKLDGTELEKMEATISNYEKLEQLISENTPNGIVKTEFIASWTGKMASALIGIVENYNESCGKSLEELLNEALPAAYNKATAEVLADQYTSSAAVKSLINGAGINYDIANDKTLTTIVNNYIQAELLKVGDNDQVKQLGAADIESKIKNLINSYLKTAGLGDGGTINVSNYGYDNTKLNDVQNAVILKKISDKLSEEKSRFAGYEKEFDEVLNKFIGSYLETSNITAAAGKSLFDTLVGKLDEIKNAFKNSKEYKDLDNTVNVYKKYRDNISDEFKTAVKTALGDNVDLFLNNYKTSTSYNSLLQGIIERINSGDESLMTNGAVDWAKVQAAVVEEVTSMINGAVGGTGALDSLQKDFERNSSDLEKAKEKAIKYCDAAKAMGGDYSAAVVKVFGSNHKSAIEAFEDTIQLATKMKTLFGLIAKIDSGLDPNSSITGWSGATSKTMIVGTKTDFQVTASMDANLDPSKITYSAVSSNGGTISMTNTSKGKFNYIAPSVAGYDIITVNTYYNGELKGSTTITIDVAEVGDWGTDPSGGHLEVYGAGTPGNGAQVSASNFTDLYNNNAVIQLHTSNSDDGKWSNFGSKDTVSNRLSNLLNMIKNALSGSGLDSAKLDSAITKVHAQFIDNFYAHKDRFSGGRAEYCTSKIQSGEYPSNAVVKQHDDIKNKGDKICYMVSFRGLVDAVLAAYNA